MKLLITGLLLFFSVNSYSQHFELDPNATKVEFRTAKFKTGDDITYSYPSTDDVQWLQINTDQNWERQGFQNYDGYAWYRFHMIILPTMRKNSYWKDSVRIFMAKVDDVCEVYLNGVKIGKSGSFPSDPEGYKTTWNKSLEFHISADMPNLNWGGDNILSVRVYDGGGPGGIWDATPYVNMVDVVDGVEIDNSSAIELLPNNKARKTISLLDTFRMNIEGTLHYSIVDVENDKKVVTDVPVKLVPGKKMSVTIPFSIENRTNLVYEFEETRSHKTNSRTEIAPYILTPPPPLTPKINGAKVFGVRPNSPFLYKIAATGKKPLQYSIENLPAGLKVDPNTGIITGSISKAGDYKMTFVVKNSLAVEKREFTVKCGDLLALTPPMGWNSWNCWGLSVSEEKVRASARAMMDKGLIDHGWTYVNIDDGWEADKRNADGTISANAKFPNMKKLGDWLHSNGMKFGIYSSPGPQTCGGYPGSYEHELQDAKTYSDWGIDYLKYDWCSYGKIRDKNDSSLNAFMKPYVLMMDGLQKQPRDIVYSLCQYGMKDVWSWGASVNGNSWRTTDDITDNWRSMSEIGFNQANLYPRSQPGRWNDPDMLVVGQLGWGEHLHPTKLTPDEQYTHVSLWAMLDAPLLIGCDLSKLDNFTLNLLTNDEVIALNQDPLGKQAQQAITMGDFQVWIKDLEDGNKAVAIINVSDKESVFRFYWNNLGLDNNYRVRDLWRQKDMGNYYSMYSVKIPGHGVSLIKIQKL